MLLAGAHGKDSTNIRRKYALNTPRTGWWTSTTRGAAAAGATGSRLSVRLGDRQSSAPNMPRTGWWTSPARTRRIKCGHNVCTKSPSYGKVGEKSELCAEHARRRRDVATRGCRKQLSRSAVGCNGAKMLRALHVETGMADLSGDGPVGQDAGWAAGFSSWRHYSWGWYWRAAEWGGGGGSLHPSRDFPWAVGAGGRKKRALVTVDIPGSAARAVASETSCLKAGGALSRPNFLCRARRNLRQTTGVSRI